MKRRGLFGSIFAVPVAFIAARVAPRRIDAAFPAYEVRGVFAVDRMSFGSMTGTEVVGRLVEEPGHLSTEVMDEMADLRGIKVQSARELRPHSPRGGDLLDDLDWSRHGDTIGSADVSDIISDVGEL